jgi:hypothetical protein
MTVLVDDAAVNIAETIALSDVANRPSSGHCAIGHAPKILAREGLRYGRRVFITAVTSATAEEGCYGDIIDSNDARQQPCLSRRKPAAGIDCCALRDSPYGDINRAVSTGSDQSTCKGDILGASARQRAATLCRDEAH